MEVSRKMDSWSTWFKSTMNNKAWPWHSAFLCMLFSSHRPKGGGRGRGWYAPLYIIIFIHSKLHISHFLLSSRVLRTTLSLSSVKAGKSNTHYSIFWSFIESWKCRRFSCYRMYVPCERTFGICKCTRGKESYIRATHSSIITASSWSEMLCRLRSMAGAYNERC